MNKTEARFTTSDLSIVAFLLWKNVLPTRVDFNSVKPLFLYYDTNDYNGTMQKYWEGDYIPACEMGQCYSIAKNFIEGKFPFDIDDIKEELKHLQDYREMYTKEITIGELEGMDSDIIKRLEDMEQL